MIRPILLALGGVILAGAGLAQEKLAGDPEEGRKLVRQCQTCHGRDGVARIPIAPHIGGEPMPYLTAQLTAFREGTREHEMMTVVARGLTDQAIANLAAWYAQQQVQVVLSAPAEDAPEACVSCHGADGLSGAPDVPNLAGESTIYLETQLKAFRNGKRTHDIMSDIAAELSDQDIRALASWYAAIEFSVLTQD
ncbi:c-type cytochrome [Yoonia sediminilitoris]|uniref:Cytochrome c553 n=1 Tax=Yoonia sediminilitoris TaxID=1286148 RepID=A0A2T6KQX7_9RHOB|nr:cytochrome c [Yoonia sediminilitoris]PUB18962.1 cytochrome c553 [Yoonia sediminilitoris]RCW99130.1 cytochrome c553 [Yoonia sediminilitoris]